MPNTHGYDDLKTNTWLRHLGIEVTHIEPGKVLAQIVVRPDLVAPNGFIHAGVIVSFADGICGSGTVENLPAGAAGHTTIELKANLLGTAHDGDIEGEATLVHGGHTTQVWDAEIRSKQSGKTIALFRCTQLIVYPATK